MGLRPNDLSIHNQTRKKTFFVIPDISFYFEYFLPEVRFVKKKIASGITFSIFIHFLCAFITKVHM